jgi:hypothetical protein
MPVQRFDLDDVGTQTGQQLGRVGECLHLLDGEHTDSLQWAPRRVYCPRLCRRELHSEYYIRMRPSGPYVR